MSNNNLKTLIVFPKDTTTDFLEEIVLYLSRTVDSALFSCIRTEANDDSHKYSIEEIKKPIYNTVLFLGHGTSISLHGAHEGEYKNDSFIKISNFDTFKSKKIILISCNSCDLIKKAKAYGFEEAIGFGDLPTDRHDIESARELDMNIYKGLSEEAIETFKNILVDIIKYSLTEYLINNLTLKEFYNLVLLRLNKKIAKYYTSNREVNLPLNSVLFRMKQEATFIYNNLL